MNSLIENLNQLGGQLVQFAWPMLWQSSLLIAFVFALDFLLGRKIRASVRYALWLAVLVKLLLPPTLALPTGAAWWLFHAPPPVKMPAIRNYTVTYDTTPLADYVPPTIALPPPAPPKLDGAGWGLLAAGAVSAALLLWLMIRWWQVARMVRSATLSEELAGLLESVRQQAGFRSRIRLKLVEGRMSPAVCGLFRPVILLPRTLAENLSPTQLRAVLLHEVFHLRRLDVWVNCAQALLQIVYWWHPLLWFANARIRRLREEAVDDAVMLALRDEADSYAPTLLEVAKLAFRRPLLSLGLVGIMESRSALRQRIERLVDFRAPRKAGLTFVSLCGICVFSAVALPMGEAPNSTGKSNALETATTEEQSLTVKVNPEIFFRNLKAQSVKAMLSPTNDWGTILMALLRDEGVDCNPPHGLALTNATGELTTQNTPEKLEIVRRVVEQLNRADGICQLPLGNNPLRKNVLVEGRFYPMTDGEFGNFTTSLHHYSGGSSGEEWWSVPPEQFKQFVNSIEASGLQSIQRPRIQTGSGIAATLYVGNQTNSLELACKPHVGEGFVDLALESTVISGAPVNAFTNHVISQASAEDHGGIVLRMANYGGHPGSNLVTVISAEIVTNSPGQYQERLQAVIKRAPTANTGEAQNLVQEGKRFYEMGKLDEAEAKLKSALALDPENAGAKYYLGLVQTTRQYLGQGQIESDRKNIVEKLYRIRLANVGFYQLNLGEVVRRLTEASKQNDPENIGVIITTATNSVSSELEDVNSVVINIPALTDVRLADVLDAVVTVADKPVKYSILNGGIVFSVKAPADTNLLFSRTFQVNPLTFLAHLKKMGIGSDETTDEAMLAQKFFESLGVNLDSPPGKAVFYGDKLGKLYVKATESDLDTIERAIVALNEVAPQIHIKARFYEVPKGTMLGQGALNGFQKFSGATNSSAQITGILNATNARTAFRTLQARSGVEVLAEPEGITTSGRQMQMRATQVVTVMTNVAFYDAFINQDGLVVSNSVVPQTSQVETGPILDVVPYVLSDGYTIYLTLIPSLTEFLGYDTSTNTKAAYNRAGEKIDVPKILPRFTTQQMVTSLNLWDNQTVIIAGLPETTRVGGNVVPGKPKTNDKELLIFVTATIVDPAGNRVHSDDALPFAQTGIPPPPPSLK